MSASCEVGTLPPFPSEYRSSGMLLHVTSLPSPYGIGDLGPSAFSWVDRLHHSGQGWWQALPRGPHGLWKFTIPDGSHCLRLRGNSLLISPEGPITSAPRDSYGVIRSTCLSASHQRFPSKRLKGSSSRKRSAKRLLGGAGLGAAIGGIAGNAGSKEVKVPSETLLEFRLQQPASLPS